MRMICAALGLLAAVAGMPAPVHADPVADFYNGRTMRMLIGYGPGGGYDLYGRVVAQFLPKHLPGHPTIVVQNMPGAGSLLAARYMHDVAPKDGSTIALVQRGMLLIKNWNPAQVRFDLG